MVGHVEDGAEAVVDGREGGVHHHADGREGVDDALYGLEGAATALLRLLDEAARWDVVGGKAVVVIAVATVVVRAVRAVATIGRAAEGTVGGREGVVGWAIALLDGARGDRRGHTRHGWRA